LPEIFLRDDMTMKVAQVLEEIRSQVFGQDAACQAASNLVTTFKAGLNDPKRPVGVLLFCGPTGVGKTEMAKTIAGQFFGRGDVKERLIRLDMSEYSGFGAAERLITEPDGKPSQLVRRIREIGQREGFAKAELRLAWTYRLVDHIAREGFDVRYGARPLLRTLEQRVVAPLARWLVDNPQIRDARIELDVRETDEERVVEVSIVE